MGPFIMFWLAVVGTAKSSARDIRLAIHRGEEPKVVSCGVQSCGEPGEEYGYHFTDDFIDSRTDDRIYGRIMRNESPRIVEAYTPEEHEQVQCDLARHGEAIVRSIEKDYGLSFLRGEEAARMRRFVFEEDRVGVTRAFQALRASHPDMALIEIARVMEERFAEEAAALAAARLACRGHDIIMSMADWERRTEIAQELIRDLVANQDEFIRSMTEA